MGNKRVVDLVPGDVLLVAASRTVSQFQRTATQVTVTFEDGTEQTWDLAGDPAVEVTGG